MATSWFFKERPLRLLKSIFATLFFIGAFAWPHYVRADYGFNSFGGESKNKHRFGLEVGGRYFTHYVQTSTIVTPPGGPIAEVQLQYWADFASLYAAGGLGDARPGSIRTYAVGLKIPFVTFIRDTTRSALGGIQFMLIAEGRYYKLPSPVAPEIYSPTGITFLYGGGINWGFNRTRLYLDTSMMVGRVQSNFFIAPIVGLGMRF